MAKAKSGVLKRLVRWGLASVVIGLLALGGAILFIQYRYQMPWRVAYTQFVDSQLWWYEPRYPSAQPLWTLAHALRSQSPKEHFLQLSTDPLDVRSLMGWGAAGPFEHAAAQPAALRSIRVADESGLIGALADARAGDVIEILPGVYQLSSRHFAAAAAGTLAFPITVRAATLGAAELSFGELSGGYVEGFLVTGPHWSFENLVIRGRCKDHSLCEHAFHVVGDAAGFKARNNILLDFNAHIKINRTDEGRKSPDGGLIEHNFIGSDTPRATVNPVTPIDLVGADGWMVRKNIIADFAKEGGNHTSYAAFFKGSGRSSQFRDNLVRCQWRHSGGIRLGLSVGGGGTPQALRCANRSSCDEEYSDVVIEGNIVTNCSDAGIYINKGAGTLVQNNALIRTTGLDVRFRESSAIVRNNVIDGRIVARDEASLEAASNLTSWWRAALLRSVTASVYTLNARGQLVIDGGRSQLASRLDTGYRDSTWCAPSAEAGFRGPAMPAGEKSCTIQLKR